MYIPNEEASFSKKDTHQAWQGTPIKRNHETSSESTSAGFHGLITSNHCFHQDSASHIRHSISPSSISSRRHILAPSELLLFESTLPKKIGLEYCMKLLVSSQNQHK